MIKHGDIFECGISAPDVVYIVCPGPNGKDHYSRIPDDAFVLATNKAVCVPLWYQTRWHVAQFWSFASVYKNRQDRPDLPDSNWWGDALTVDCVRVFGECLAVRPDIECDYSFEYRPDWNKEPNPGKLMPDICRTGCSIASAPLQWAYWAGAKQVVYVGCDMYGDDYMDGTVNFGSSKSSPVKKDHRWGDTEMLNEIIAECQLHGMKVYSLSETELDLEVI